jgi:pimeloyl-ACP methyl ester carboxylesterase
MGAHPPPFPIVFVHGIWMPGVSMRLLASKLESRHGYSGHLFSYETVKGSVDENAALLAEFIADRQLQGTHLVGHSLGGVVALRMLRNHDDVDVGRVVCLGSPLCGSRAARGLARHRWGRAISGNTLSRAVLGRPASAWAGGVTDHYEVGVIAGTTPLGAGRLLTKFDGDNDGTVAVSETRLPGARDHVSLPVSHTGLLLSNDVVMQTAAFLDDGEFR